MGGGDGGKGGIIKMIKFERERKGSVGKKGKGGRERERKRGGGRNKYLLKIFKVVVLTAVRIMDSFFEKNLMDSVRREGKVFLF